MTHIEKSVLLGASQRKVGITLAELIQSEAVFMALATLLAGLFLELLPDWLARLVAVLPVLEPLGLGGWYLELAMTRQALSTMAPR
jgi:hypothetical protein